MSKTKKRKTGDIGEDIVCKYLEKKGFTIKGRNYLKPWGELDIIAEKDNKYYFVEVKSVTREPNSTNAFRPEENMHVGKIKRLQRAVQTYLLENRINKEVDWQIDLACVYMNMQAQTARVEILENIIL